MGDKDSVLDSIDNILPFPFMHQPPPPPPPSHHHQEFNFPENSTPNPHHAQNPYLLSPRNPHQGPGSPCSVFGSVSGSVSGFLNHPAESSSRMQEVESLMGGLRLSENPCRLNGLYSGPYASPPRTDVFVERNHYLREMRIRDAANATMAAKGFNNNYYGLGYGGRVMNHHLQPAYANWRLQLVSMAMDSHECRILQARIKEGSPEEIEMIISGVQHHLHELITDPYGNYVIERLFDSRSVSMEQLNSVLVWLIRDLPKMQSVCMDATGTRVVQKILEKLNMDQQIDAVTLVMKLLTNTLMKNVNGSHVIQQCLKIFPPQHKKVLLDEIACNCVDIAIDRCGSSAIQKCLGHAGGQGIWFLVREIIINASFLAQDPYGNYLVQYLIQMELKVSPSANQLMIQHLSGEFVTLSMDKHASNVIEALLQLSEPEDAAIIVVELMKSPEFMNVLRDPYGNFVVQRAMECTKGSLRKDLCCFIRYNCGHLHSHLYGKNVLAFAKRCKIDA